jgi:hypothetical protein
MPPPKQKPIAASPLPGRRPASSVTPAFMSSSKRSGGAPDSAAATSASPGNAAVPPSSESRSMASAEKPPAAKRPATERMWSVRPRFSWITRTPPSGRSAAAQAAISVPRGPSKVIGSVATGAHSSTSGWRPPWPCPRRPRRLAGAVDAWLRAASAASIADAAAVPTPSSPRRQTASRRVMMPSAWSSATSSARYRWSSVMNALPPPGALAGIPSPEEGARSQIATPVAPVPGAPRPDLATFGSRVRASSRP